MPEVQQELGKIGPADEGLPIMDDGVRGFPQLVQQQARVVHHLGAGLGELQQLHVQS